MSSVSVDARCGVLNTEFDAAQTLLALQSNSIPKRNVGTYAAGWQETENREEVENAAKLILSCFITSNVSKENNIQNTVVQNNTNFPLDSNVQLATESFENKISSHCDTPKNQRKYPNEPFSSLNRRLLSNVETDRKISKHNKKPAKIFRDAETQTEEPYFNPKYNIMETTIKNLCDRIKSLEAQLKTTLDQYVAEASIETAGQDLDASYDSCDQDPDYEMDVNNSATTNESKYSRASVLDSSAFDETRNRQTNKNVVYNSVLTNLNTNSCDNMIRIGDGNATVPSRLLKQINWNSYSSATRKLLTAVFTRRILATHSLTGKPSPAFPNKPAKKRLNPMLVNDIVQTVVERCRVPENVVRTSITTKCADESKMFRTREKNKKKRSNKNRENISPPLDSESDDY